MGVLELAELFSDAVCARNVYHVVSARSHVFTDERLANPTAITWLYRGETGNFVALIGRNYRQVDGWLATRQTRIEADGAAVAALLKTLQAFAEGATPAELNEGMDEAAHIALAALEAFRAEMANVMAATRVSTAMADTLKGCKQARSAIADNDPASHASQVKPQAVPDPGGCRSEGATLLRHHVPERCLLSHARRSAAAKGSCWPSSVSSRRRKFK